MLLQKIKEAQLNARKSRDLPTANILTTLIGEAEMVGKSAGNRESTDAEVIQTLRKFEKGQVENVNLFAGKSDRVDSLQLALFELGVIRAFLPTKITDDQVQKDIRDVVQQKSLVVEQKSMGVVVKELKAKYGDQFDGGQVSAMFKQIMV
jgi:uncharacterized protein YqeY